MSHENRLPIRRELCRAFWPESPDAIQPLFNHGSESAGTRVLRRTNLISEPEVPEQRYRLRAFGGEAPIRKPHEKVEDGRRCGQDLHSFEIVWKWVRDQLLVELVAKHDDVLKLRGQGSLIGMIPAVQDLGLTHEVEAAPLDHRGLAAEAVRAEEDRRAEDALERTYQATILFSAGMHAKALQHFGRSPESYYLALLLDC